MESDLFRRFAKWWCKNCYKATGVKGFAAHPMAMQLLWVKLRVDRWEQDNVFDPFGFGSTGKTQVTFKRLPSAVVYNGTELAISSTGEVATLDGAEWERCHAWPVGINGNRDRISTKQLILEYARFCDSRRKLAEDEIAEWREEVRRHRISVSSKRYHRLKRRRANYARRREIAEVTKSTAAYGFFGALQAVAAVQSAAGKEA